MLYALSVCDEGLLSICLRRTLQKPYFFMPRRCNIASYKEVVAAQRAKCFTDLVTVSSQEHRSFIHKYSVGFFIRIVPIEWI